MKRTLSIIAAILLTLGLFAAPATAAASPPAVQVPASYTTYCGSYFGFSKFSSLRSWLTSEYGAPNSNQV